MKSFLNRRGFTLVEVIVAVAIFALFALGIYEGVRYIYKVVYISRVRILETAVLSEELEIARNLAYSDVGISGGVPTGVLPYTKTVVRNGVAFNIIATVRNVDDVFDGLATGTVPIDTAPADYKLVEMSIVCAACLQKQPVILSTIVAPKNLENATKNGSLFINVFDSHGKAVSGANVNVSSTAVNPHILVNDVTDNDGWLRIVDIPTATISYNILVTKGDYSSDYTIPITGSVKPPSTVASQTVTEIYFAIDRLGSLNVGTINPNCSFASGRSFNIWGEKIIARGEPNVTPDTPKYSRTLTTDGGSYALPNMEWDKYWFSVPGAAWSIGGTIPMLPVDLAAGASQDVSLVVRPYSAQSLLVNVKDSGTLLPLSGTSVRLFKTGYDQTIVTGLGYMRQTDWSGGNGQITYDDAAKYFSDSDNLEVDSPAGDVKLKRTGGRYATSGWLESSTFDIGSAVNFQNIIFDPLDQQAETGSASLRFQIATSNSSTPASWDFKGPDGTDSSYYTATSTLINDSHDDQRYLRYRVFLSTADDGFTPHLFEVAFTFTSTCVPPGQSYFDDLDSTSYQYEITRDGYSSASGTVEVDGNTIYTANLATE